MLMFHNFMFLLFRTTDSYPILLPFLVWAKCVRGWLYRLIIVMIDDRSHIASWENVLLSLFVAKTFRADRWNLFRVAPRTMVGLDSWLWLRPLLRWPEEEERKEWEVGVFVDYWYWLLVTKTFNFWHFYDCMYCMAHCALCEMRNQSRTFQAPQ